MAPPSSSRPRSTTGASSSRTGAPPASSRPRGSQVGSVRAPKLALPARPAGGFMRTTPEQQKAALAQLQKMADLHKGAGPAWTPIGAVLDWASKPASVVGNSIKGDWKDALKAAGNFAFPGSQYISPVKSHDVYPGDALAKRGLLPGGKLGIAARFVGNVALDPTTYVTLGTGAGIGVGRTIAKDAAESLVQHAATAVAKGETLAPKVAVQLHTDAALARAQLPRTLAVGLRVPFTRGKVKAVGQFRTPARVMESVPGAVARVPVAKQVGEGVKAIRSLFRADQGAPGFLYDTARAARWAQATQHAQYEPLLQALAKAQGNVPKSQVNDILHGIEGTKPLDITSIPTAKAFKDIRKVWDFEEGPTRADLLDMRGTVPGEYVPHGPARNDAEAMAEFKRRTAGSGGTGSPTEPFMTKSRSLPTLAAWEQAPGLTPELNPLEVARIRSEKSAQFVAAKAAEQAIAHTYGVTAKNIDQADALIRAKFPELVAQGKLSGKAIKHPGRGFEDTYIPEEAGQVLNDMYNQSKFFARTEAGHKVRNAAQQLTALFKGTALVSPRFHIRNVADEGTRSFLSGARNPYSFYQSHRMVRGKPVTIRTKAHGELSGATVREIGRATGTLNVGYAGREMAEAQAAGRRFGRPSMPGSGFISRKSRQFGEYLENTMRGGSYIEKLKRGDNVLHGAIENRNYHYDYGDLSPMLHTSRNVGITPFITYPWKTAGLLGRLAVTRPGVYSKLNYGQEALNELGGNPQRNLLPPGKELSFGVPVPGQIGRIIGAATGEPVLFNPQQTFYYGVGNMLDPRPTRIAKNLGSLLGPEASVPVQAIMNYSMFRGRSFNQGEKVRAPWYIEALHRAGVPIPGYGDMKDPYTGATTGGWSPRWDALTGFFPPATQSGALIPPQGTEDKSGYQRALFRWLTGADLYPEQRARNLYYAQKYGR